MESVLFSHKDEWNYDIYRKIDRKIIMLRETTQT
jgi:hypothetical protein